MQNTEGKERDNERDNESLPRELMKHQNDAVDYLMKQYAYKRGGALFMEMRLGKTLSMIRFLKLPQMKDRRVVVIAPLIVCRSWTNELELENESYVNIGGLKSEEKAWKIRRLWNTGKKRFLVLNYEAIQKVPLKQLITADDVIIADESIVLANPKNLCTKSLLKLEDFPQRFKYVLCGEPAPEHRLQYVTQMLFCQRTFMRKDNYYSYLRSNWDQFGRDYMPKSGHSEAMRTYLRERAFILSRAEAGIGSKKVYEQRHVEMTPSQKKAYDSMLYQFETEEVSTNYIITQLLYLCRIAGGMKPDESGWYTRHKLETLVEMLSGELRNEQVIVWFRFRAELKEAVEILRSKFGEDAVGFIHGDVKPEDRESVRLSFMTGKTRIVCMTISTAKRGTDWSSADTAIYFSNEYSGDARMQSEDRIVHPKKKVPVLIIDLLTVGSVDCEVVEKLTRKKIDSRLFKSALIDSIRARKSLK